MKKKFKFMENNRKKVVGVTCETWWLGLFESLPPIHLEQKNATKTQH
jgi:hypothetical protein